MDGGRGSFEVIVSNAKQFLLCCSLTHLHDFWAHVRHRPRIQVLRLHECRVPQPGDPKVRPLGPPVPLRRNGKDMVREKMPSTSANLLKKKKISRSHLLSRIFWGFRSLWITPFSWAAASASASGPGHSARNSSRKLRIEDGSKPTT